MRLTAAARAAGAVWAPAVAALLAVPLTLQPAVPPARWVAGLVLAFVLPGMSATAALFPSRALSTVERVVLAPALSLAVLVLGGLLLNAVGIRLTAASWATLTASTTVVMTAVGYLRRRRATGLDALPVDTPDDGAPVQRDWVPRGQVALKLASLAAVVLLLAGASWFAMTDAVNHDRAASFTALSIVPATGSTPEAARRPVDIAIDSHESTSTQYSVQVRDDQAGLLAHFTVALVPGEVFRTRMDVPVADKVTVELFKDPATTPYRTVFLSGQQ